MLRGRRLPGSELLPAVRHLRPFTEGIMRLAHQRLSFLVLGFAIVSLGCKDSPTDPSATPIAPAGPARIAETSNLPSFAYAGSVIRPVIVVFDDAGRGIPGLPVTFTVTAGGGEVTLYGGGTRSTPTLVSTTNKDGVAPLWGWGIANRPGRNELTVTAEGFASLVLVVDGKVGAAAIVRAAAGRDQEGTVGAVLPTRLAVLVTDAVGNPVSAGTSVRFAVRSGAGTITQETATTDTSGIATAGFWTLGRGPGIQVLIARLAAGSDANWGDAIFSATAHPSPVPNCGATGVLFIGQRVSSSLSTGTCVSANSSAEVYTFTVNDNERIAITMTASGLWPLINVFDEQGSFIATDGNQGSTAGTSTLKWIATPGTYTLVATSRTGALGNYSIEAIRGFNHTCGEEVFLSSGVTTFGTLSPGDCNGGIDYSNWWRDEYRIHLMKGEEIRLSMTTAGFNGSLAIWRDMNFSGGPWIGDRADLTLDYAAEADGVYVISAGSSTADATGSYVLKVR